MAAHRSDTDAMIERLSALGDLKVWSVLVTILGDLTPRSAPRVPGPYLTALTARLGIRAEALRVARHRLRKDGWIQLIAEGRINHYGLSASARVETEAVRDRIYAARIDPTAERFLCVSPEAEPPRGALGLSVGGYLHTQMPVKAQALCARLEGPLPGWVPGALGLDWAETAFDQLDGVLAAPVPQNLAAIDRVALRVLVLHNWRRVVLRLPERAEPLLGDTWAAARCRTRVAMWLDALPAPTREEITGSNGFG